MDKSDSYKMWEEKGYPIDTDMLHLKRKELEYISSSDDFGYGVRRFAEYILDGEVAYSELIRTLYQHNQICIHQAKLHKEGKSFNYGSEYWNDEIKAKIDKMIAEDKGFTPVKKIRRKKYLELVKPEKKDDGGDIDYE